MSEHPLVDPDVAIDSFLPLLQALDSPGLQLINGKYVNQTFSFTILHILNDDKFL